MAKFNPEEYRENLAENLKTIESHSERREEDKKMSETLLYIKAREKHLEDSAEFRERNEKIRVAREHVKDILNPKSGKEKAVLGRFSQYENEFKSSGGHRGLLELKTLISLRKLGLSDADAVVLFDELKSKEGYYGYFDEERYDACRELGSRIRKIDSAKNLVDVEVKKADEKKVADSLEYSLKNEAYSKYEDVDKYGHANLRADWEKLSEIDSQMKYINYGQPIRTIEKDTFEVLEQDLRKYVDQQSGLQKIAGILVLAMIERSCSLPYESDFQEAKKLLMDSKNWSGYPLYEKETGNFSGYYGVDSTSSSEGFETYQGNILVSLFDLEQDLIVQKILKMRQTEK